MPGNNEEKKLETVGSLKQCAGHGLTSSFITLAVMNHLQRTSLGFLGSRAIAVGDVFVPYKLVSFALELCRPSKWSPVWRAVFSKEKYVFKTWFIVPGITECQQWLGLCPQNRIEGFAGAIW